MTGKIRGLWEPLRDPAWKSYGYQPSSMAYGSHYQQGRQRKLQKVQPRVSQSWGVPAAAAGHRKPPHALPGGHRSMDPRMRQLPPVDPRKYLTAESPPPLPAARRALPSIAPGHHEHTHPPNPANAFMEGTLFQRNLQAIRAQMPWHRDTPQNNQLHMTFEPLPDIAAAPSNALPGPPDNEDAFSHSIPSASSDTLSSVSSVAPWRSHRSSRVKGK